MAHRLSETRVTLDMAGRPIPVVTAEDTDLDRLFAVESGDTPEERARKVQDGLRGELGRRVLNLPAGLGTIDLLQPDVSGVTVGLDEVDQLTRAVRDLSSIPSLTGSWTPASGESLKRQLYPLYFETRAMQLSLASAVSRLLGVEVEWQHIFDILEMEDITNAEALLATQGGVMGAERCRRRLQVNLRSALGGELPAGSLECCRWPCRRTRDALPGQQVARRDRLLASARSSSISVSDRDVTIGNRARYAGYVEAGVPARRVPGTRVVTRCAPRAGGSSRPVRKPWWRDRVTPRASLRGRVQLLAGRAEGQALSQAQRRALSGHREGSQGA